MTFLLLLTLCLTLVSLLTSSHLILSTILPLVPRHVLSRCVPPTAFGLPAPETKLSSMGIAHLLLGATDLFSLALFAWQSIADTQSGSTVIDMDAGTVTRLWMALTSRPTLLLLLSFLALLSTCLQRPLTFGPLATLLWAPTILLIGGTTLVMGLLSSRLPLGIFLKSLTGYTTSITLLSSACFLFFLLRSFGSPNMSDPNVTRTSSIWPTPEPVDAPRPSFATEDINELRRSASWLTSYRGSSISTLSSFAFTETASVHHAESSGPASSSTVPRKSSFWFGPGSNPHLPEPTSSRPSTSQARPPVRSPTPDIPSMPGTPCSSDALIRALEGTNTGLRGYSPNPQDAAERGDRFSFSTDMASQKKGWINERLTRILCWAVYVWLPFVFTLPFLTLTQSSAAPSPIGQVLLCLSITLSSPLFSLLLLLTPTPSSAQQPMPAHASTDSLPLSIAMSRAASPTLSTMSGAVWLETGMATPPLHPWARALNFLRPSPKLAMRREKQPDREKEVEEDGMMEIDLQDGQLPHSATPSPASHRASFSWRDPRQPSRSRGSSLARSVGGESIPPVPPIPGARISQDDAESFTTQILRVERLSSSAAMVLSIAPSSPPQSTASHHARSSMDSVVSERSSRSKKSRSSSRTPPPRTPPPEMPLPPLPPKTPRHPNGRPKTARGRSASLSAATTPSTPSAKAESSGVLTGTPTPGPSNPLRLPPQSRVYQPCIHRAVNSTGSIDSVTKAMLEAMVPGLKASKNDITEASIAKVRRVMNATEQDESRDVQNERGLTTAREDSQVRLRKDSEGNARGHYSLPSLHMTGKGPQSAARWSEDLDQALEEARIAESTRQMHRRARSKSALGDVKKVTNDPAATAPTSTPPLHVAKSRLITPSPEALHAAQLESISPDPIPRRSFIVAHQATPPVAEARPAPSQLTPSVSTLKGFHLPRKSAFPSVAPPRPRSTAGPVWVYSGQATPANTPNHPPHLAGSRLGVQTPRRPLSTVVEGTQSVEDLNQGNVTPIDGVTFVSAEHSTPLPAKGTMKRLLKLVGSASSLATTKSKVAASPTLIVM